MYQVESERKTHVPVIVMKNKNPDVKGRERLVGVTFLSAVGK
jgi:hypothetical protein